MPAQTKTLTFVEKFKPKYPARLIAAAKVLENLPRKTNFDMSEWGSKSCSTEKNHCGTTACALGWISLDPKINAMGLKGKWDYCGSLRISYKDYVFAAAAAEFFGIPIEAAEWLFVNRTFRTAKNVAKELRMLARGLTAKYKATISYDLSGDPYYPIDVSKTVAIKEFPWH